MNFLVMSTIVMMLSSTMALNCSISGTTTNKKTITDTLYQWCISDTMCSNLYSQFPTANYTVFSFLTRWIVSNTDYLEEPLYTYVCGNQTTSDVLQSLWLLSLYGMVNNQSICDGNHLIQVDLENMSAKCVCKPGHNCSDNSNVIVLFGVIIGLILAISMIILFIIVFRIFTDANGSQVKKNA